MNLVIRAAAVYFTLLLLFRIAGKRSLSQVTPFDFVLLLIISECTQQALIGLNNSVTGAMVVVTTLIGIEVGLSWLKGRSQRLERWLDGAAVVIVEEGRLLQDQMKRMRVDEEDILEVAQAQHGLMRMDQIRFALIQRNGQIAVIPRE